MVTVITGGRIERPISVVQSHFVDFEHHVRQKVHPGLALRILSQERGEQRIEQTVKMLGLTLKDELVVRQLPDGSVLETVVAGTNLGGSIHIGFREDGTNATFVYLTVRVPAEGWKARVAPLLKVGLLLAANQTLAEDRRDLEAGNYYPKMSEVTVEPLRTRSTLAT